jgi:hypothetical protein
MTQILGLSLALLLFGSGIWANVGGGGGPLSPKIKGRGCRTPSNEGSAVNQPFGCASLITEVRLELFR